MHGDERDTTQGALPDWARRGGAQVKHLRLRVYVQDNVGRQWGYDICAVGILAGLVVFLSGTRKYRFKKLVWRPLT